MKKFVSALLIIIMLGGYGFWALNRPIPALEPSQLKSNFQTSTLPSTLQWPSNQAAVSVLGTNITEVRGAQTPIATASTAKIITALMTL